MAMTTCPNCGEQISDKAKKCVHCGTVLVQEEKKYCPDCGAELEEGMDTCPKCGCPIENIIETEKTPQQVEVAGVKITKKSKKIIMIAIIAVIGAVMIAAIGVQTHKKNVAAKAAAEAQKQSEEYGTNLNLAAYTMLSGASDAETCGNLIKNVWYNAIYKESDSKTDKYTKPNGYFVSDFNDALKNLFSDSSFSGRIADINSNKDTVNSLMKKLKNPPEEYKDAYEALSKLYDAYISLTNLATDPTGSLQTFSKNFNDADNETLNCYNALKMYLEE
ncbi:zinc ribbon domain-containing protein [Mediterraneibacter sp. 210702-DFI.5.30]|uniref:zinc ribbon domain-containing protein n=1 Tax=Mediterraneibacter sp. 210702-DFI.5.30 TaxID=2883232 RepID=UPI001D082485|nr:zinc ribbon domain-containing protein [Mediterraneibacter sp. 210702-DFI.5.30]MCB6622289.1 zinc ribbon domain-containing protein [Mediterraneibacter sp. 210702-DFI.5.30]